MLNQTYNKAQIEKKSENLNFSKTVKELESRISELEGSIQIALEELDSIKNGRENLLSQEEVNKMIRMLPVQRSVSIPVTVDQGGTGAMDIPTAVQNLGITVRSVSSNDNALNSDQLILVDATSGNVTITLTTAESSYKKTLRIKKTDSSANTVILDGYSSETIDGSTTYTLLNQYETATVVCDGSNWWRI